MNKISRLKKIIEYNGENEISIRRMTNNIYRVGYCSQCGKCCSNLDIQVQISDNVQFWLEGYGIKVTRVENKFSTEQDDYLHTVVLSIPIKCTYLESIGDNKHTCARYDKRPAICIGYPKSQSKWDTCTYVFVNQEELDWFQTEYIAYWSDKENGTQKIRSLRVYS